MPNHPSDYLLLLAATTGLLVFAGCGSSHSATAPTADLTRARSLARAAARDGIRGVHDRHLPGPKRLHAKCHAATGSVVCTVTAYTRPTVMWRNPDAPFNVAVAEEQWRLPVDANGQLGQPQIVGAREISGFLEADNSNDCSGGESLDC